MRTRRLATISLLATCACAPLVGCSGSLGRDAWIRMWPAPELVTLHQRPVDVDNEMALMTNENLRMFVQDLGRVFYTNRASRLTREPIPHP